MKITAHIPGSKIENFDRIEKTVKEGFGLELQITADVLESAPLKYFSLIKEIAENKPITIHAPFLDLNPGAVDSLIREATIKRFKQLKPLVNILEPEVIVFHSGFHPRKTLPIYDRWLKNCTETFKHLSSFFGKTKLAIENVFDPNPKYLKELLENINKNNIGICIDVGHLNIFSEVSVETWLDTFKEKIYEFHLHDNDRKEDSHIAAGEGSFNFKPVIEFLKEKDVVATFEAKTLKDQIKSYNFIIKNLSGVKDGIF